MKSQSGWQGGLLLLLLVTMSSCAGEAPERSLWSAMNPAGSAEALLTVDAPRALGSSTVRLRILQGAALRGGLSEAIGREVAWQTDGCNVLYVFWLDDRRLEVQLDPVPGRCPVGKAERVDAAGFSIDVTIPESTAKADVMRTSESWRAPDS